MSGISRPKCLQMHFFEHAVCLMLNQRQKVMFRYT